VAFGHGWVTLIAKGRFYAFTLAFNGACLRHSGFIFDACGCLGRVVTVVFYLIGRRRPSSL